MSLTQTNAHISDLRLLESLIIERELHTPAAAINMSLTSGAVSADLENASNLISSSDYLLHVIDDLRVAINPEEDVRVQKQPFNAENVTSKVVSQMNVLLSKCGMKLHVCNGPFAHSWYGSDDYRLGSVVTNLVHNGCLHSQGQNTWLSVNSVKGNHDKDLLTITIEDDGVGIAEQDI